MRRGREQRKRQIEEAITEYIGRAIKAADDGDIAREEATIVAAWKWAGQADNVWGAVRGQLQRRIEAAMSHGQIRRAAYLGFVGDMHFWTDRIVAEDGVRLMDEHVQASIETGGQILQSKRPTLTRMAMGAVLPGTALIPGLAFAKTEIKDLREVYFIVEHPEWARMVKVDPQFTEGVREVVVAVNQAARQLAQRAAGSRQDSTRLGSSPLDDLRQLGELRSAGVLTDAEFEEQKARLLARLNEQD